jgi:hypothetical protein
MGRENERMRVRKKPDEVTVEGIGADEWREGER